MKRVNVLQSISAQLIQCVFQIDSILSGKACQDLELTPAEQQALPWRQAAEEVDWRKTDAALAGKDSHQVSIATLSENWDAQKIAFDYEMPVSHWIQEFKYYAKIERGRLLADLFTQKFELQFMSESSERVQALIPVPVHLQRYRERGFNQSQRLAKRLSDWSDIPMIDKAVWRIRHTPPQAQLDAKQRKQNLQDAFAIDISLLESFERIALVDDVVTTGATMNELVRQIRQQTNIKWIEVWAIAQTQVE